jgi:hypothetical protein
MSYINDKQYLTFMIFLFGVRQGMVMDIGEAQSAKNLVEFTKVIEIKDVDGMVIYSPALYRSCSCDK